VYVNFFLFKFIVSFVASILRQWRFYFIYYFSICILSNVPFRIDATMFNKILHSTYSAMQSSLLLHINVICMLREAVAMQNVQNAAGN